MSSRLKAVDLTSFAVGQSATIDFSGFVKFNPSHMQEKAHLALFNESGCGLNYVMQASNHSDYLPAGAWIPIEVEPNDGAIVVTVDYVLPNPPVSRLTAVYYAPGERVPTSYTLGNSPIGIGGSVTTSSVQTLSNEGNAANTLIIDIGDAALSQLVTFFTDHFTLKVDQSGVAHGVIKGSTTGNAAQIGQTGDTSEVLGALQVDQTALITGLLTTNDITVSAAHKITAPETTGPAATDLVLNAVTSQAIRLKINEVEQARVDTTGIVLPSTNKVFANEVDSLAASNFLVAVPSAQQFQVSIGGTTFLALTNGNLHIDNVGCVAANLQLPVGGFAAINTGTTAASGTVNHGLGIQPAAVLMTPSVSGSTWTFQASTYTTTQFTATLNSALTTRWVAYK